MACRSHLLHRHARRLCRRPRLAERNKAGAPERLWKIVYPTPGHGRSRNRHEDPVRDQVNRLDAVAYFTLLAQLMKTNPPALADAPALARFAKIGLVPGQDFDARKLNADFVRRIPEIGFDRIMLQFKVNPAVKDVNGWGYTLKTGIYGTDYLMR